MGAQKVGHTWPHSDKKRLSVASGQSLLSVEGQPKTLQVPLLTPASPPALDHSPGPPWEACSQAELSHHSGLTPPLLTSGRDGAQ